MAGRQQPRWQAGPAQLGAVGGYDKPAALGRAPGPQAGGCLGRGAGACRVGQPGRAGTPVIAAPTDQHEAGPGVIGGQVRNERGTESHTRSIPRCGAEGAASRASPRGRVGLHRALRRFPVRTTLMGSFAKNPALLWPVTGLLAALVVVLTVWASRRAGPAPPRPRVRSMRAGPSSEPPTQPATAPASALAPTGGASRLAPPTERPGPTPADASRSGGPVRRAPVREHRQTTVDQ